MSLLGSSALTPRLIEILQLSADGNSSAQIAELSGRTVNTVKHQRLGILRRLGADNMAQAVAIGMRRGMIE